MSLLMQTRRLAQRATLIVLVSIGSVASQAGAQSPVFPSRYTNGVVVSESRLASHVGRQVMEDGGNAVDAAVATAFALAVTLPQAGNIGGGGFLVVRGADGQTTTFDFREKAPLAARETMFLDAQGQYDRDRHHWSALSVGVPGSVAGLALAHERLGSRPWKELVEPAVQLAGDGFPISPPLAASLKEALPALRRYPATQAQFTKDGNAYTVGERLVQKDLARTLERIRDRGRAGFYNGQTADLLVAEMQRLGGFITHVDLQQYEAVERAPIVGQYRDCEIIGMAPPSTGGIAAIEMLNILQPYRLRESGPRSAHSAHLIAEAMRRAYADRARYLGDPDHVEVPVERLTSLEHAAQQRRSITLKRASVSTPERFEWPAESAETTHLSVVDRGRMAVALTTTLERSYGSRIVVPGAGFLLNNEMGDFNPVRGQTTARGQIGTDANLTAPGKRMISSMSPTIVTQNGELRLVLGSPGGRTIINSVLLVILGVVEFDMAIQEAVDAPRFHHQWLPDQILVERWCFSRDTQSRLESWGHKIEVRKGGQGSVMAILVDADGRLQAGVDRRRGFGAAAGH